MASVMRRSWWRRGREDRSGEAWMDDGTDSHEQEASGLFALLRREVAGGARGAGSRLQVGLQEEALAGVLEAMEGWLGTKGDIRWEEKEDLWSSLFHEMQLAAKLGGWAVEAMDLRWTMEAYRELTDAVGDAVMALVDGDPDERKIARERREREIGAVGPRRRRNYSDPTSEKEMDRVHCWGSASMGRQAVLREALRARFGSAQTAPAASMMAGAPVLLFVQEKKMFNSFRASKGSNPMMKEGVTLDFQEEVHAARLWEFASMGLCLFRLVEVPSRDQLGTIVTSVIKNDIIGGGLSPVLVVLHASLGSTLITAVKNLQEVCRVHNTRLHVEGPALALLCQSDPPEYARLCRHLCHSMLLEPASWFRLPSSGVVTYMREGATITQKGMEDSAACISAVACESLPAVLALWTFLKRTGIVHIRDLVENATHRATELLESLSGVGNIETMAIGTGANVILSHSMSRVDRVMRKYKARERISQINSAFLHELGESGSSLHLSLHDWEGQLWILFSPLYLLRDGQMRIPPLDAVVNLAKRLSDIAVSHELAAAGAAAFYSRTSTNSSVVLVTEEEGIPDAVMSFGVARIIPCEIQSAWKNCNAVAEDEVLQLAKAALIKLEEKRRSKIHNRGYEEGFHVSMTREAGPHRPCLCFRPTTTITLQNIQQSAAVAGTWLVEVADNLVAQWRQERWTDVAQAISESENTPPNPAEVALPLQSKYLSPGPFEAADREIEEDVEEDATDEDSDVAAPDNTRAKPDVEEEDENEENEVEEDDHEDDDDDVEDDEGGDDADGEADVGFEDAVDGNEDGDEDEEDEEASQGNGSGHGRGDAGSEGISEDADTEDDGESPELRQGGLDTIGAGGRNPRDIDGNAGRESRVPNDTVLEGARVKRGWMGGLFGGQAKHRVASDHGESGNDEFSGEDGDEGEREDDDFEEEEGEDDVEDETADEGDDGEDRGDEEDDEEDEEEDEEEEEEDDEEGEEQSDGEESEEDDLEATDVTADGHLASEAESRESGAGQRRGWFGFGRPSRASVSERNETYEDAEGDDEDDSEDEDGSDSDQAATGNVSRPMGLSWFGGRAIQTTRLEDRSDPEPLPQDSSDDDSESHSESARPAEVSVLGRWFSRRPAPTENADQSEASSDQSGSEDDRSRRGRTTDYLDLSRPERDDDEESDDDESEASLQQPPRPGWFSRFRQTTQNASRTSDGEEGSEEEESDGASGRSSFDRSSRVSSEGAPQHNHSKAGLAAWLLGSRPRTSLRRQPPSNSGSWSESDD